MMKYELLRYEYYKDSGVEWIGKTPFHWEVTRNKDIFEERGSLSDSGTETLLTVSHITGVTRREEKNVNMFMAETMEGYKLCEKGDLIINTMWAWMGALGTSNEKGICSPAYGVYKHRKGKDYFYRYFDYLYRTPKSIMEMTRNSKGIVSSRWRLYSKEFFQMKTSLPNYETQKTISEYLDTKTAQIDRKIDLLTQKATKYGELKQCLINETVTRGLDKAVTMKDSGIEWIGKVPEHWNKTRVKDLFTESKRKSITGEETLLSVSEYSGVTQKKDNIGEDEFLTNATTLVGYKICCVDDLVINIMLAWKRGLGVSPFNGIVSPSYAVYSPSKLVCSAYFHYLFRSERAIVEFKCNSTGIIESRLRLYTDSFYALEVAIPEYKEQKAIADYLDIKTTHIDRIVETINTQIENLKELRKTLINDVVTGKIKVCKEGKTI